MNDDLMKRLEKMMEEKLEEILARHEARRKKTAPIVDLEQKKNDRANNQNP